MKRSEALDEALRKNRGRAIVAQWTRSLASACGVEPAAFSFLDLDATAELKASFVNALLKHNKGPFKRFWPKDSVNEVTIHLLTLAERVGAMPVVLFSKVDDLIGAVELPAERVLPHALAVWRVVEYDLSLVTRDVQHAMCLEETQYSASGEYLSAGMYEFTGWGAFSPRPD